MADDSRKLSGKVVKGIVDVIILILGIVLLAVPNATMQAIIIIIGIIALAYGGIALFIFLYNKDGRNSVPAVICVVLGILLLVFSNTFANTVLPFIIGAWMLVMGIIGLAGTRKTESLSLILTITSVILGIIIIIGVFAGANIIAPLLGVCMIIYGIAAIIGLFTARGNRSSGKVV